MKKNKQRNLHSRPVFIFFVFGENPGIWAQKGKERKTCHISVENIFIQKTYSVQVQPWNKRACLEKPVLVVISNGAHFKMKHIKFHIVKAWFRMKEFTHTANRYYILYTYNTKSMHFIWTVVFYIISWQCGAKILITIFILILIITIKIMHVCMLLIANKELYLQIFSMYCTIFTLK